jgi:transposase
MELPNDISSCHRIIRELVGVLEGLKPQLEGYVQQIEAQRIQIESQQNQIVRLELRVKELESQLKQNSHNSSRPPSSDSFRTKPAFPRTPGGKIGGKFGHDGGTLKMVEKADFIVEHKTSVCAVCGKTHFQEPLNVRGRRQVFDIPAPKIEVTEHRVLDWVCCGCAHENSGKFPGSVSASTQYGLRLQTTGVLFNNAYNIPRNKVQLIFKDLFGVNVNESTLQTHNELAFAGLETEETHIKNQLLQSEKVHFDETGIYVGKARIWEHVASNERFTHLFVHAKRGELAHHDGQSILPGYQNWAVHDCWASYFLFKGCKHAVCGAHLLRELTALIENGSIWAKKGHQMLLDLYERTEKGLAGLPKKEHAAVFKDFQKILEQADKEEPPPVQKPRGKPKKSKGRNLLDRLQKHTDAVLAFVVHKEVPFTNNQAERDIRPTKTKMKVSGCFRTTEGANIYARVQGFVSTVRKLHFNPFNELHTVLSGGIPEYRRSSC